MKKTIVIITILLSSISATAQEKQNDATWEETIAFLKEHIERIDMHRYTDSKATFRHTKYDVKINDQELIVKTKDYFRGGGGTEDWFYIVDLKHLTKVQYQEGKEFGLEFETNSVKYKYNDENKFSKDTAFSLFNDDKELSNRLAKAFKHLAYLANEKRKQSKF